MCKNQIDVDGIFDGIGSETTLNRNCSLFDQIEEERVEKILI